MNTDTIVLMGNGKSLFDIDLDVLSGVDTMGINGAFVMYSNRLWTPTYYAMLRKLPQFWGESGGTFDVFMKTRGAMPKKVFFVSGNYPRYEHLDNVELIHYIQPRRFSPDASKWAEPFNVDIETSISVLQRELGDEETDILLARCETFDERLNWRGIYKLLRGSPIEMNEGDFIKHPRWIPELDVPDSFDNFYYSRGSAGYVAVHICRLLGYKKILLVGFDFNFKLDDAGIVDISETFGIRDVFSGRPYDVSIDYSCPSCRNESYLHDVQLASWKRMVAMIERNSLDIEIINCTPGSKLLEFPMSTLEVELNKG